VLKNRAPLAPAYRKVRMPHLVPTQRQAEQNHLIAVIRAMTDKTPVTFNNVDAVVKSIQIISPRALGLIVTVESKLPAATMKVKMWGMQSLRVLFHNPDLTEQDFMAALESDALTEMVATIADDQVFRMKIRIALSTFNGEWEGHVNHVTRAP
jgi:hypothetical protein